MTKIFQHTQNKKLNETNHLCMAKGRPKVIQDDNTPPGVAIGLVEIFAGCLLCIIPHPATIGLGVTAIADGGRKLINAGEKLDEQNRANPKWPEGVPRPIPRSYELEDNS